MIRNIFKSVTVLQLLVSISLLNATNSTFQLNDVNEGINKQSSKSSESSNGTTEETSLDDVIKINEILKIDDMKKQLSKLSIANDDTIETSLDNVFNINDIEGASKLSRRRVRYLNREDYYATKLNSRCEESQEKEKEQKYVDEDEMSEYYNLGFNNKTYSVKQLNEQPNQIPEQLKQNKIEEKPKKKSIVSFIKHLFKKKC